MLIWSLAHPAERGGAQLSPLELEAVVQLDRGSIALPCHGITDRLNGAVDTPVAAKRPLDAPRSHSNSKSVTIGSIFPLDRCSVDRKWRGRLLLLACQKIVKSASVWRSSAFEVDGTLHDTASEVDGTGPAVDRTEIQAVEPHLAKPTLVNITMASKPSQRRLDQSVAR